MSLFENDTAGNRVPKAWRDPKPPTPFSRVLFTKPLLLGFAVMFAGAALTLTSFVPPVVGFGIMGIGAAISLGHCAMEIRRQWHEIRWQSSPAPKGTLDDEGIL